MAAEEIPRFITPQEYLQWEQDATSKSEYHNGVIIAMAGGDPDHNRVTFDTGFALRRQLSAGGCEVFTNDQRVVVPRCNKYFYPDVVMACGEPTFESIKGVRSLQNPIFIAEVLSPSTEDDDRTDKLMCYMTLPSLQVYMLVSQRRPRVETFTRQPDGFWQHERFDGLDAVVPLPAIGCELRLSDVYERITFPFPQLQNTDDADSREQA